MKNFMNEWNIKKLQLTQVNIPRLEVQTNDLHQIKIKVQVKRPNDIPHYQERLS